MHSNLAAIAPGVRDPDDDALMALLLQAACPEDVDRLFAELYSRYHARVNSWCRRFVRDRCRADDLTQEVFMRAFRYRHSYRGEARTSTWLFTITRNYCLTAQKKANGDPSTAATLLDPRLKGSSGFETQHRMERDEAFNTVWGLVRSALTPREARIMVLHYGHGVPLALITRQLTLTNPSGAKAYIVNAKRKLSVVLARRGHKPTARSAQPGALAA